MRTFIGISGVHDRGRLPKAVRAPAACGITQTKGGVRAVPTVYDDHFTRENGPWGLVVAQVADGGHRDGGLD